MFLDSPQNMEVDDFLHLMAENASEFPEFASLSRIEQENMANINIKTGPAKVFHATDGRILGVGGIRIVGVGEAWMITPRYIRCRADYTKRKAAFQAFLMITKEVMKRMCDEHNLWRVFATGTLSTKFLEQLGFERIDKTLVWSRTE